MSEIELNKELNIGVPIYRPVPILTDSLSYNCSIDRRDSYDALGEITRSYVSGIETITGEKNLKTTMHPVSRLDILTSDLDSSTSFGLSKKRRYISIFEELVDKEKVSEDKREEVRYKRFLSQFAALRTPEEKSAFIKQYDNLLSSMTHKAEYLMANGRSVDIAEYYNNQARYLNAVRANMGDVLSYDVSKQLTDYLNTLDVEKTVLYMADVYLNYMEYFLSYGNKAMATELSFYVDGFLKNSNNKSLRCSFDGEMVSYSTIRSRYNSLRKAYDLNPIHLSRRLFEGKSFEKMVGIINSIINVETLEMLTSVVKPDDGVKEGSGHDGPSKPRTAMTEEEQELLDLYLEDKYYHYIKHNPLMQIEGIGELNNYTTFLYENGVMPSDRFRYSRLGQTKSDRAFVFDVDNFERMRGSTKNCLRLSGEVRAMNHNDTFVERMDEEITKETSAEMREKAKEFVKRYKKN